MTPRPWADLRQYVDARARRGGFATPSEYVRHLIREDREKDADRRLEELLLEGVDSGPAQEITDKDWQDIRSAVRTRLAERPGDKRKKKRRRKTG